MARFGYRDVGLVAFLLLLIPFGILLEPSGSNGGPDRGGGVGAAALIGTIGACVFVLVNGALLVLAWSKADPIATP